MSFDKYAMLFLFVFLPAAGVFAGLKNLEPDITEADEPGLVMADIPNKKITLPEKVSLRNLVGDISLVLCDIEKKSPSLLENAHDKTKIINAFVKAINPALSFEKSFERKPDKKRQFKLYPAVLIASNRIFYVRIDGFSHEQFEQLLSDSLSTARLDKKPLGVVLDLRNCEGRDNTAAMRSAALFIAPNLIPVEFHKDLPERALKLPMAVLLSDKTEASAEILGSILCKTGRCLTVGGISAGQPFRMGAIPVADGCLAFPVIEEAFAGIVKPAPLTPLIKVDPFPQINYEKLSGKLGSEKQDKCLLRACELLISLDALKGGYFDKAKSAQ